MSTLQQTLREETVWNWVARNPNCTTAAVAEGTKLSYSVASRALTNMHDRGIITRNSHPAPSLTPGHKDTPQYHFLTLGRRFEPEEVQAPPAPPAQTALPFKAQNAVSIRDALRAKVEAAKTETVEDPLVLVQHLDVKGLTLLRDALNEVLA